MRVEVAEVELSVVLSLPHADQGLVQIMVQKATLRPLTKLWLCRHHCVLALPPIDVLDQISYNQGYQSRPPGQSTSTRA